jgi:hypothetical protein
MTVKANPNSSALPARGTDELKPFLRSAGDGTYEVVVPLRHYISPLILPYSFPSEEVGTLWIKSQKGSERIDQARTLFE